MRRFILPAFLLPSLVVMALGKLAPLTVKDISLMLRSGYSVAAVEGDLASRHFLGPVDAASEKQLTELGATPALLASLKSGRYTVPAQEILAVQQEMEAKARHRTEMVEESKKASTLYQDKLMRDRAAAAAAAPVSGNVLAKLVKGHLVVSKEGAVQIYDDQPLDRKKLIALYFSAGWCGPCRKFTPDLVAYYNRIAATHPEFEIVFVSNDRSASAMAAYMRDMKMPWPAVKFEKIAAHEDLQQFAGSGIPCLVLLDAQGKVVSHSYAGTTYRGPEAVLADLDKLFAGAAPAAMAQSR